MAAQKQNKKGGGEGGGQKQGSRKGCKRPDTRPARRKYVNGTCFLNKLKNILRAGNGVADAAAWAKAKGAEPFLRDLSESGSPLGAVRRARAREAYRLTKKG